MLKVIDIISHRPITLPQGMSLRRAMARLVTEHISGAPVEDSGRLVGVITCCDLLMFAAAPLRRRGSGQPLRAARGLEQPSGALRGHSKPADEGPYLTVAKDAKNDPASGLASSFDLQPSALDEYAVRDAMTTTIHTIEPDADVIEAAERMVSLGAHRLLVVQENRLVGIVSTTDITKAVADGRLRDLAIISSHGPDCDMVRYSEPNLLPT